MKTTWPMQKVSKRETVESWVPGLAVEEENMQCESKEE